MGIGAALMEELVVEDGRVRTLSLAHYKLPTSLDVPALRLVLLTSTGPGPFGAKMAGELSTSGVAPAIANAIADACGAQLYDLPLTAERVYRGLTAAPTMSSAASAYPSTGSLADQIQVQRVPATEPLQEQT